MDHQGAQSDRTIKFGGYHQQRHALDLSLMETSRGTLGGEYLRRFWHPVAYERELGDVPLRVRALSEDMVVFKDKSGQIGCLQINCCHRNTSLEFGIIEERGLRCCYHGRLFDVDGAILEMPGEPAEFRARNRVTQGAYPAYLFGGIVFVYMGAPERKPIFPIWDRFEVPGLRLVPGERWQIPCNWLQIRENALDPAHTATLHSLPQYRGGSHFADEFGRFPALMNWFEAPAGIMYMAVRKVGENIWIRSNEALGPTYGGITTFLEDGLTVKRAALPFVCFYLLPIDDHNSVRFYIDHVADDEPISYEERTRLLSFGQRDDRPYHDRQFLPGDYEALSGQGEVNSLRDEHLGHNDRGVLMFRRYVRRGIEAVQNGTDPDGVYYRQEDVPPTFTNDFVMSAADFEGDPNNTGDLTRLTERVFESYVKAPPMRDHLKGDAVKVEV